MGKIRVATLGDEQAEQKQKEKAKARREGKKALKEKTHIEGVGLKGGQQIKVMEGSEIKPEIARLLEETPAQLQKEAKQPKKKALRVRSQRYQKLTQIVDKTKSYPIKEAVKLMKKTSTTKFDGTLEMHVNLNPATLPGEKPSLNGTVHLPHGTGKKRVIVIADEALIAKIATGKIDFDVLVSHPSLMPKLAKVARILGPKGLMPNPKTGTISTDPEKRVKELAGGELAWKTEPDHPVIHQVIGKVSFTEGQISENLAAFVKAISAGKIAKLTLNATMGPGIKVDLGTL